MCVSDYGEVEVPPRPLAIQSFDGSGPRLMITHIVNENFKSYANVQSLGPFHKVMGKLFLACLSQNTVFVKEKFDLFFISR